MTYNVAVYARISTDQEGLGLGVARQEQDCRALAALRSWTVAYAGVDNDISAYKRGVIRPAFERLLTDLEAGLIDGIVAYDLDRFARKPSDLERAIDIYDTKRAVFATVQGDIDLSTPDGRTMARVLVAFANKSSMDTSRRVTRKQLELAQAGKVGGGGTRPYGYELDQVTVREDEAAIIRQIVKRVLATESLTSIANDLSEQGVLTSGSGTRWTRSIMKKMLLRPRMAGLRTYKGTVLLDDNGQPVRAEWPAIISVDDHEQLKSLLTEPGRNANAGRIDRKYLLSGILRCKCGCKMYGAARRGVANYMCSTLRGCGKTHRRADHIDKLITELVLRFLEQQELPQHDIGHDIDALDGDIEAAEKSIAALINEWNEGRMSDQIFFTSQAKKEASLTALKRQRTGQRRQAVLRAPVGIGVRPAWEAANLSQKRAIVSEVLLAVQVLDKPHTAPRRFDPAYYVPVFREVAS